MKNNRTTALLMLLVFLLVVAVVIIFLTGLDRNSARDNPYETVTTTAEPVITPETPPEASVEPTPAATSAPVYYPASTAAPVTTAAPVSTARPSAATATATPSAAATPTPIPTDANGNPLLSVQDLIPVVPGATTAPSDGSGAAGSSIPVGTNIGSGSFRSDTGTPQRFKSWITESRVMPGRMVPEVRGAVMTSPLILKKALEVPISSTYLCSAASSHSTSLQSYFMASRLARMPPP